MLRRRRLWRRRALLVMIMDGLACFLSATTTTKKKLVKNDHRANNGAARLSNRRERTYLCVYVCVGVYVHVFGHWQKMSLANTCTHARERTSVSTRRISNQLVAKINTFLIYKQNIKQNASKTRKLLSFIYSWRVRNSSQSKLFPLLLHWSTKLCTPTQRRQKQ